ncbi:VWA domain-containing protein [Neorhodopirellula lusitana]|uniref:VWA domain-containing protein n=1 Tax=Neorhodopirellula lusitana TaxID=445327 RepID=UPI00384EB12A
MEFPTDVQIGNRAAISWLFAGLVILAAMLVAGYLRRVARKRFATADRLDAVFSRRAFATWKSVITGGLVMASIVLLTLGLMDFRWGKTQREVPQKGIEVMFLLDVSRSMLAQDTTPNRLERAKQMIRDMVASMAGDRVGLIAFAGETRQIIPLTNHYEDFSQTLTDAGPDSVRRGGSKLGDAISVGGDSFLSKTTSHRVMIVLTDGEDQESQPVKLAKRLHDEEGIRIFTIGLGDMETGSKIPDAERQGYITHQGKPVLSKLNGKILQEVAVASDGVYIPAGTKQVDMNAVYQRYIANIEKTDFDTAKIDAYEAKFQWFALPAFLLLLIEAWWTSPKRSRKLKSTHTESTRIAAPQKTQLKRKQIAAVTSVVTLALVLTASHPAAAETALSAIEAYNQGVANYQEQNLDGAIENFQNAVGADDPRVATAARYNLGTARVAKAQQAIQANQTESVEADLRAAIASLRSALRLRPRWDNARANLEQAVNLLNQLQQQSNPNEQPQSDQNQDQDQSEDQKQSSDDGQKSDSQDSQDSSGEESPQSGDQPSQPNESSEDQPAQDQSGQGEPSESTDSQSDSQDNSDPSNPDGKSEPTDKSTESEAGDTSEDAQPADDPQQDASDPSDDAQPNSGDSQPGELAGAEPSDSNSASQPATTNDQGEPQTPLTMTEEEAQKMLQAVRDRDMIRRFRQQQLRRLRQVPVEQDW